MARPTKYQEAMCQIAEDHLAEGYSKRTVSAKLEINSSTLYEWIDRHIEFSNAIDRGMQRGLKMFEDLLVGKMKNKNNQTHENILMFVLKARFRDVYGEKKDISIEVPQGINIIYADEDSETPEPSEETTKIQ